jgi:hypothetical protein
MYKTRTRIVSFRLSEDEYERLKDVSRAQCARSVSEFARSTLCELPVRGAGNIEGPGHRIEMLEGVVGRLNADMRQLRQLVEGLIGLTDQADQTTTAGEGSREQ